MTVNDNQFLVTTQARFSLKGLIVSAALATALVFTAGAAFAAEAHQEHAASRIKELHSKLKITPAQEEQWGKVAKVMLDDAKVMDALTQTRADKAKDLTAIDDLKSYSEIAEAHATGIKNLTAVFTDLYAGMSETQKKEADILFREGGAKHARKHKHKKSAN